jgi:hypothetical protein
MAFSQTSISDVAVYLDGAELFITWSSSAPPGTTFQVYVDRQLAWHGISGRCRVPIPAGASDRNTWIEVGTVGPDEPSVDYSSSLGATGGDSDRVQLSWLGGTYLDPSGQDDVRGFRIFRSATAGAPVDLTTAIDTVAAYPGGWISDGFGLWGFGQGGFGRSANLYRWTSGPLSSGVWQFAVIPFDGAGNLRSPGQTLSATIQVAPRPPAMSAGGTRLAYTYSGPTSRQATLNWLASPSQS